MKTIRDIRLRGEEKPAEDRLYENKYKINFEGFEQKLKNLKNEEVFEQEDDYLDWRYARESLGRLKRQKQALEHA